MICIAAPLYLKKIGELKTKDIVVLPRSALALLLIPAVGSVYPVPAPPVNYFPYIFADLSRRSASSAPWPTRSATPRPSQGIREELTEMRMPGGLAYK